MFPTNSGLETVAICPDVCICIYIYICVYLLECLSYIRMYIIFQMGLQGEIDKVVHLKQVVPTDLLKLLSFHLSFFCSGNFLLESLVNDLG